MRDARRAGLETHEGAEEVFGRIDRVPARQSLQHVGRSVAHATADDRDTRAAVQQQAVVGFDVDDSIGPHDLPVGAVPDDRADQVRPFDAAAEDADDPSLAIRAGTERDR